MDIQYICDRPRELGTRVDVTFPAPAQGVPHRGDYVKFDENIEPVEDEIFTGTAHVFEVAATEFLVGETGTTKAKVYLR